MKYSFAVWTCLILLCVSCKNSKSEPTPDVNEDTISVKAINHGSLALEYADITILVDPVGDATRYKTFDAVDIILVTDIHGDHFDIKRLEALASDRTKIILPQTVADRVFGDLKSKLIIMNNGDNRNIFDVKIEAVPMYNLREEALKYHTKGRGNGYVLTLGEKRVYISGDTEDIPEMRALKNIDMAFVCMNLPYTMPVESAANAVLEFKPKIVYPYHYRGTEGLSDVSKFKEIVSTANPEIKITQLNWYKD